MEAKDRITKTNEENCHNTLEERLAEQDRISFEAGEQQGIIEGAVFGSVDITLLSPAEIEELNERAKEYLNNIKQTGIREVVRWINHNYWTGLGSYNIPLKGWQAKLREWGIE